jgi:hypothetical protein
VDADDDVGEAWARWRIESARRGVISAGAVYLDAGRLQDVIAPLFADDGSLLGLEGGDASAERLPAG